MQDINYKPIYYNTSCFIVGSAYHIFIDENVEYVYNTSMYNVYCI